MSRPGLALVLTLLCFAGLLPAAESPNPATLVRELGSEDFQVREEATLQLFRLGRVAVPALERGLKEADAEVRRRSAVLLPLAKRSDEDLWLDDFVAGTTDPKKPMIGWAALQKLVGDGVEARMLFAELYRGERGVLELLEKDPNKLGSQAMERARRLQQRFGFRGVIIVAPGAANKSEEAPAGEVAAALLAAAVAANGDQQAFYQLTSLFYQPAVRSAVQRTPGANKLIARVLARQGTDIYQISQTVYIARNLGLQEYIEETLKPAIRKQAAGMQPGTDGRFTQLVYMARQLEMNDLVEEKLMPGVRKMAEEAAKQPQDVAKFQQAVSLTQTLQMQETMEAVLKPAGLKLIQAAAERPDDMNGFYQVQYIARSLGLTEAVDTILRPAACRHLAALVTQPGDINKFYQAQNMARLLQLNEAVEGVLQPAARKIILETLEQSSGDLNRMTQVMSLARSMDLGDMVEDTLKPWARRQAASLNGQSGDLARITQLHQAAQMLGLRDVIDNDIKPVFRKVVQSAADQPINQGVANQVLNLARTMGVKEAAPYALKVALARGELNAHTRGTAILFLADHGSKEEVSRLEVLLDDTASVGATGFNWTTIHAEIRDVALGVLVHHSGQSLAEFGFPYFQAVPGAKLSSTWPGSLGFADAKSREETQKKWKEWSMSQKK